MMIMPYLGNTPYLAVKKERCHLLEKVNSHPQVRWVARDRFFLDHLFLYNRKVSIFFSGGYSLSVSKFEINPFGLIIRPTQRNREATNKRGEHGAVLFNKKNLGTSRLQIRTGGPARASALSFYTIKFSLVMKPRDANKLIGFSARLQLRAHRLVLTQNKSPLKPRGRHVFSFQTKTPREEKLLAYKLLKL